MSAALTVCAVGDVMLGEGPYYLDRGVRSALLRQGVQHPFAAVRDLLGRGDLVLGNLEAVCAPLPPRAGLRERTFRAPPEAVAALAHAGFTHLSVANNHFLGHGEQAAAQCQAGLLAQGIQPVGWGQGLAGEESAVWSGVARGTRVGLIALCDVATTLADGRQQRLHPDIRGRWVTERLRSLRASCEVVLVTVHWGAEYVDQPCAEHGALARAWIDAGAGAVLGHGPHVVQGIEWHAARPILYSLGNFLFDQVFWDETRTAMVAELVFDRSAVRLSVTPVRTSPAFRAEPLQGDAAESWRRRLEGLSGGLPRASAADPGGDGDYPEMARRVYWQVQRRYLAHVLRDLPRLSWRSAASLTRDMGSRLGALWRSQRRGR
jgi:poly-gamma-glutamate synthesis protein (capsule biosynthesis protein)